jgi:hypothetical protein
LAKIVADGGVISETCSGTCIIIDVTGTPAKDADGLLLSFNATGQGVGPFDVVLDKQGNATKAFAKLTPDTDPTPNPQIDRFFTIPVYPPGGSAGTWQTDQINCSSALNDGSATWVVGVSGTNSSDKISLTVLTIAANDFLTCSWHLH